MVKYLALFLCWITLASNAQGIVFSAVKKLTPNINSSCEEIFPLLSPDQKVLYFVRAFCPENTGGKFSGSDIWVSHYDVTSKEWGKPTNSKEVFNDKSNNALVGISYSGLIIYQLNTSSNKNTPGIYSSKRLSNSWTRPQLIPLPHLNTEEFLGLYVSPDFNVILISMKGADNHGLEDLYVSLKNSSGKWSDPLNLGPVINSEGFEISPFLSPDMKRLYFSSSGHWGMGDGDIFYADRLDDSWENWSTPVNLGTEVNSKSFDAYFSIYDSIAYFSSNRDSQFSDLYVTKIKSEEDSMQLRIQKIVAEAKLLLNDLGDDTTDSLATNLRSIFIGFGNNSVQMSSEAIAKLNLVVARIKNRKSNTITLVAYTNSSEPQEDKLSHSRLEVIRNYLKEVPLTNLIVEIELNKEFRNRSGVVEIRYEY